MNDEENIKFLIEFLFIFFINTYMPLIKKTANIKIPGIKKVPVAHLYSSPNLKENITINKLVSSMLR